MNLFRLIDKKKKRTLFLGSKESCERRLNRNSRLEVCISPGKWEPYSRPVIVYCLHILLTKTEFYFESPDSISLILEMENENIKKYADDVEPIDIPRALEEIKKLTLGKRWTHDLVAVEMITVPEGDLRQLI